MSSLVLCLILCSSGRGAPIVSADTPSKSDIKQRLKDLSSTKSLRSSNGDFVVYGTNRIQNLEIMKWARQVSAHIEKTVGMKMPSFGRTVRIVLCRQAGVPDDLISVKEEFISGVLVQSIVVRDYHKVNAGEVREHLCRLLLCGYLPSIRKRQVGRSGDVRIRDYVPQWLSTGLAQNLDSGLRELNTIAAVKRWEKGGLMSVSALLLYSPEDDRERIDPLMSSVFVSWLTGLKERRKYFRQIFRRLDKGEDVSAEWIAPLIPNCKTAGDVEEQWDYWLNGRRRVIYRPGVTTSDTVRMLRDRLLLYPGNSGIPLDVNPGRKIRMRDLVGMRDDEWLQLFCQRKSDELRLFAAGRGEEVGAVVKVYCDFLSALAEKDDEKNLKDLLTDAEKSLEEIKNGDKENHSR